MAKFRARDENFENRNANYTVIYGYGNLHRQDRALTTLLEFKCGSIASPLVLYRR